MKGELSRGLGSWAGFVVACFALSVSGYSQEAITRLGNRESLGPLIEKPFTVDGLLGNVRSVLNG